MNEQSVGLVNQVTIYVAQEVGIVINDNRDNGGQINIGGEHLTPEPELPRVHPIMTFSVGSGHVTFGAYGSSYYNVGTIIINGFSEHWLYENDLIFLNEINSICAMQQLQDFKSKECHNRKITFLFLNHNICCEDSRDSSFKHPKHMLKIMCKKIFTILVLLSTQNICSKLCVRKYLQFYAEFFFVYLNLWPCCI